MAAIPTVPHLVAGYIPTVTDMNNLAYACTFLYQKPLARVHDSAGSQAISGSAYTTISFGASDLNNDSIWSAGNPTRLTIQTPGWYKVRYAIVMLGAGGATSSSVYQTTGANNPQGAGVIIPTSATTLGGWLIGYETAGSSGVAGVANGCGVWPAYLYVGDYLQVQATANTTGNTTNTGTVASYFSVEFVSL